METERGEAVPTSTHNYVLDQKKEKLYSYILYSFTKGVQKVRGKVPSYSYFVNQMKC